MRSPPRHAASCGAHPHGEALTGYNEMAWRKVPRSRPFSSPKCPGVPPTRTRDAHTMPSETNPTYCRVVGQRCQAQSRANVVTPKRAGGAAESVGSPRSCTVAPTYRRTHPYLEGATAREGHAKRRANAPFRSRGGPPGTRRSSWSCPSAPGSARWRRRSPCRRR